MFQPVISVTVTVVVGCSIIPPVSLSMTSRVSVMSWRASAETRAIINVTSTFVSAEVIFVLVRSPSLARVVHVFTRCVTSVVSVYVVPLTVVIVTCLVCLLLFVVVFIAMCVGGVSTVSVVDWINTVSAADESLS